LQEALAQRAASADAADWSYSDYELAAIRAELNERQLAKIAQRISAEVTEPSDTRADVAPGSCAEPQPVADVDAIRLRMLIARCFKPSRRRAEPTPHGEFASHADLTAHRLHGHRDASVRVFSRLQRLR